MKVTDPTLEPRFDMARIEKEEFLLFCICVAGKNARTTQAGLHRFWTRVEGCLGPRPKAGPFDLIREYTLRFGWDALAEALRSSGIGCYHMKAKYLIDAAYKGLGMNLDTCTAEDLERIQGVGPKTSRFFLLWTRKDIQVACLDTHVLRWLREQGVDAPKTTPTGKKYAKLEQEFLGLVPKGMTPMEFDFQIWTKYHKEVKIKT